MMLVPSRADVAGLPPSIFLRASASPRLKQLAPYPRMFILTAGNFLELTSSYNVRLSGGSGVCPVFDPCSTVENRSWRQSPFFSAQPIFRAVILIFRLVPGRDAPRRADSRAQWCVA